MNTQLAVIIMSALLFAGVLTAFQAPAATSIATVSAEIISPTDVASNASELLKRASGGEFNLRIPGGGSSDTGVGTVDEITLRSIWLRGSTIVISTSDSTPQASLVLALASSGGGMNGILSSGQGVNLSITHAEDDGTGKGRVYAIIAYN